MALVRTRRIIDDAGASAVIAAAEQEANAHGHRVVIAVVDPHGELIELRRTPGAQIASSRVAVDKARTAAIFVRPSREIEEQVHEWPPRRARAPRRVRAHRRDSAEGGWRGRRRDRHERRDARRGRGHLDRRRGRGVLRVRGAGAHLRGRPRLRPRPPAPRRPSAACAPVISAVDAGGALMYLVRPDSAQVASVEVTTDKARTAAIYRRPSKDFEDQASGGRPSALHLARAVPLQGGVPIEYDGVVIGAIGVSGATDADEDRELAELGVASHPGRDRRPRETAATRTARRTSPPPRWTRSSAPAGCCSTTRHVQDRRGPPRGPRRGRVPRARRRRHARGERPRDGGDRRLDGRPARGRARASSAPPPSRAAEPRELSEGDVLAIPNGVPHQFTDVSDPFLYFVVKVAA